MRKITQLFFVFTLVLFTTISYGQNPSFKPAEDIVSNGKTKKKSNVSTVSSSDEIVLNEENQRFLDENGVVRCLTEEMNEHYRQANPNRMSKQQFEDWIAPLVEDYKSKLAAGVYSLPQVQIPVIFHVIYGSEAVGVGPNLDAQYVNAQIDQLNIDFAGTDPDVAGSIWAGVAGDAQITFVPAQVDEMGNPLAEPGINRVGGYPGQLTTGDFDNTIKPATIWDRTQYANIWTGDLGGGLLGYAQFPDNSTLPGMPGGTGGAANTDGVVCLYTSIGSELVPHPNGGVYAAGRTLTHEIGHWIGLRHIWGDGNCTVDDFCADTPTQGGSSSGCPTTADTCNDGAGDQRDMVENFMDYSFDTCMFLFTLDQVARMAVVLQNSPGRDTLPNSNAGNVGPTITFAGSSTTVSEGSDCSFTDVTIDMNIGAGPTANATANLTVSGGTAANTSDFELLTNSVNFSAGATASQTVTVRVYNDSFSEGDETIEISFTVNANGGDATAGNNTYTITVEDDDVDPIVGGNDIVLFQDDFESGFGNWTVTGAPSPTNFVIGNDGTFPDANFFNPAGNATNYAYVNDDDCNCDMSDERMSITAGVDLTSYTEAVVSFDYSFDNQYVGDIATLELSLDGGTTWPYAANLGSTSTGPAQNVPFENAVVDLTPYVGQVVHLSVVFNDNGGWGQGLVVDNFLVTTPGPKDVQTAVDFGTTDDSLNLVSTGLAHASDSATDNAILDIDNTSGFDFGCTTASVSRAGLSAQPYNGSSAPALAMDKTFTIAPTNSNSGVSSTISFYVTESELAGWEATTGDVRGNLRVLKNNGGAEEDVALNITPFGTNHKLTATFTTGITGTYYFGNLAFLSRSEFTFDGFALYPNPTNGLVNIKFNTTDDVNIDLYDIRGRSVYNNTFNQSGSKFNQQLDLNHLSTGIYVLKIESGSNTMFKKLVVN